MTDLYIDAFKPYPLPPTSQINIHFHHFISQLGYLNSEN
jgi:hypothetical protein